MDLPEFFEYSYQAVKWSTFGGVGGYLTLLGLDLVSNFTSKKINSHEELEEIVAFEADLLGISTDLIHSVFVSSNQAYCKKSYDGYTVVIGGIFANESAVRHELYHIHKGHVDTKVFSNPVLHTLNYLFRQEPQAILYQIFRLKL